MLPGQWQTVANLLLFPTAGNCSCLQNDILFVHSHPLSLEKQSTPPGSRLCWLPTNNRIQMKRICHRHFCCTSRHCDLRSTKHHQKLLKPLIVALTAIAAAMVAYWLFHLPVKSVVWVQTSGRFRGILFPNSAGLGWTQIHKNGYQTSYIIFW